MLVQIKPIERKTWHGKTGAEAFSAQKKVRALVDANKNKYATGLTEEEIEHYAALLGEDLNDFYNPSKPHPFWDGNIPVLKLENHTLILNTESPLDYIRWKIATASKYVANSMAEVEDGLYPEASHVIFNESEEVELKASKIANYNAAKQVSFKLAKEAKINLLLIGKHKSYRKSSDNFIEVALDELINEAPDKFLELTKMNKTDIANRALVIECIHMQILVKEPNAITYFGESIGTTVESAATYLGDPKNQQLLVKLKERVID